MRTAPGLFFVTVLAALSSVACGDSYDGALDENGVVFGISQRVDPQTGKTSTTAGYEYLALAHRGPWAATVARAGDGVCNFEELDRRVGRAHVGDGGRARFGGAGLPQGGLVVDANAEDARFDGPAFTPGKAVLFDVESGFALPHFPAVRLFAPTADVAVDSPQPGELAVDAGSDLAVAWTPPEREPYPSRIMIALETEDAEGRGNEVRCFFEEHERLGTVPQAWLSRLGPPGTKGTVTIASHRQVTVVARGGWMVYVVGTVVHRDQPFVLR